MAHPNMQQNLAPGSGRASADLGQPMFPRPNSTSYQPPGAQAYRGHPRPFIPGQGSSQPMMRPGSTNAGAAQMHPSMAPQMMTAQSPPVHHPQPMMMHPHMYQVPVSPTPMGAGGDPNDPNAPHMMRMASNQSPYYPQMAHGPQPGFHAPGMQSPGMMQPQPQPQPQAK